MTEHESKKKAREQLIADATSLGPDEADDLSQLADLVGDPLTWVEPRAGLEDAVVQAVETADPAPSKPAHTDAVVTALDRRRPSATRRWQVLVSVAAVVVAAVLIGGALIAYRGNGRQSEFTAQLAATSLVPGASATADIERNAGGFRIALDAQGLPVRASGEFYEAWLKNDAGTLVPIGTFSSSDTDMTLWSGVSPAQFPILSVTIESPDNDQSSSGRVVLTGRVNPG